MTKRLVSGVGVNDADYTVQPKVNGKQVMCKYYKTWRSMLVRAYCSRYHERFPTYIGCSVHPNWHSFMAFREWMEQQDWEGRQLDKDILVPGNKVYSSGTCLFVTRQINNFFTNVQSSQRECPVGVCWDRHNSKWLASYTRKSKSMYIGRFTCPQEASRAYCAARQEYLKELIDEETDPKVKTALEQYIGVDI